MRLARHLRRAATMEAERTDWASIDAEIEAKVRRRSARAPRGLAGLCCAVIGPAQQRRPDFRRFLLRAAGHHTARPPAPVVWVHTAESKRARRSRRLPALCTRQLLLRSCTTESWQPHLQRLLTRRCACRKRAIHPRPKCPSNSSNLPR